MISVLIPVYRENIFPLVSSMIQAFDRLENQGEIIISDVSPERMNLDDIIDHHPFIRYYHHKNLKNRAQNRNYLAQEAKYEYLIFLDCDAVLPDNQFLERYIKALEKHDVICGGTIYQSEKPRNKEQVLRWKYGLAREVRTSGQRKLQPYASFSSFNFCIKRHVFNQVKFDENINQYGHEDTFFGHTLQQKGFSIGHIDNPLIHNGLEDSSVFLEKTLTSVESLLSISHGSDLNSEFMNSVRLWKSYKVLKKLGLTILIKVLNRSLLKLCESNLQSEHPIIRILDLYKLTYLVKIQG
jgi:glycosyltransferase involved in cell wall biosynthesis